MGDDLEVRAGLWIPAVELEERFLPSGGPGGQHANRSNTRVELRFDVAASSALRPSQRNRILERLGPEVRVVVDDERSQLRNRDIARRRLAARLRGALHVEAPRRPTKPSRAARARRVDAKRRRGDLKRQRRRPSAD